MSLSTAKREICTDLSRFLEKDRVIVRRQMNGHSFTEDIVVAVARRCLHGCPQVLLCYPLSNGRPFPTQFWLTCPYLSRLCGARESAGGVRALEEYLKGAEHKYRMYNALYALKRQELLSSAKRQFLRLCRPALWKSLRANGIGGIRAKNEMTVKCLHLQLAAALGLPGHPALAWFKSELGSFSCKEQCCL